MGGGKEAVKTKSLLWKRIVSKVKKGSKYGKANSWNARKAQYAVKLYKEAGGGYKGEKTSKNSLAKWTKQDWKYSSKDQKGKGRYLPAKIWKKLSPQEKAATNKKKKESMKKGKAKAPYSKKVAKLVRNAK